MNNLIDLLMGWSTRLTYRILQLTGTDQRNLDNYMNGMREMKEERAHADEVLREKLPKAKVLSYVVVFVLGILAVKIYRKYVK